MAKISNRDMLWPLLCLAGIVAIGAWLRFRGLALNSLWLDETYSWFQAKDSLADVIRRTSRDNYPPLHNLFLYSSIKLFGDDEWALRVPSAILGTANILLVYWLGSMTIGRTAALLAAAFLALSSFHIYYSQEARMYALLAFTATWFAASSFLLFAKPSLLRGGLVALSGFALLYTHPFGALNWFAIVVGIGACLAIQKRASGRAVKIWAMANAASVVGFMPWAWLMAQRAARIHEGGFWIPYPTPDRVLRILESASGGPEMAVLFLLGTVLAIFPVHRSHGVDKQDIAVPPVPVFLAWAFLPIGMALLMSVVSTPIFISRYLIGGLPAICLISAYGLVRFISYRPAQAVAISLALVTLVVGYTHNKRGSRQDWRAVSKVLEQQLGPSDCVVIFKRNLAMPIRYYYRDHIPCLVPLAKLESPSLPDPSKDRIFIIAAHVSKQKIKDLYAILENDGWSPQRDFKTRRIDTRTYVKQNSQPTP